MSRVAFIDDNFKMARCYQAHSYSDLSSQIVENKSEISCVLERNGDIYGYEIIKNIPLTEIYQFPCYVVKFVFSGVETLHHIVQEKIFDDLIENLRVAMVRQEGYYNLRVPAHIVDLMRAINSQIQGLIHCGGTMEELYTGGVEFLVENPNMDIFFADWKYADKFHDQFVSMAYDSFEDYSSQYHISPITSPKAGEIYKNWIKSYFDHFKDHTILVASCHGEPVSYHLSREDERFVEGVLISVNKALRGRGIYRAMISTAIQYAEQHHKTYVTSTQLDNYITQGTWGSLGMRQLYAIYNFHFDNRKRGAK